MIKIIFNPFAVGSRSSAGGRGGSTISSSSPIFQVHNVSVDNIQCVYINDLIMDLIEYRMVTFYFS